jgi:hypothetical protein
MLGFAIAYPNVRGSVLNLLFLRSEPDKDTLNPRFPILLAAIQTSFWQFPSNSLLILSTRSNTAKKITYAHYGIHRNNPEIWQYYDFFNQKHLSQQPETGGLFDMNRYENL